MSRAQIVITNEQRRAEAARWLAAAPIGTFIEFRTNKRSLPQNDRMHAMIRDVATQLLHDGQRLDIDDWKLVFLNALGKENRVVKDLYGVGRVNLSPRTSRLTKEEMSQLMELIMAFGTEHGVKFHDDPIDQWTPEELVRFNKGKPPILTNARAKTPRPIEGLEKKAADILNAPNKLNKEPAEPHIKVVFYNPRKKNKRTTELPSTTEGYIAYAQDAINTGSPSRIEEWFLSQEQVALRQDCKVGTLATNLLHSLIRELKAKCAASEPA